MSKPLHLGVAMLLVLSGLAACGGSGGGDSTDKAVDVGEATSRSASLALACSGCHSANSSAVVSLDGYGSDAMRAALQRYKSEIDGTTVMHRLARGYSDEDIALLAAFFDKTRAQP